MPICIALLTGAMVLAGCSKLKNEHTSTGDSSGGGSAANSNSSQSSAAPPAAAGTPTTWEANASSLHVKQGDKITLACSPAGTAHAVWGSDIYTTDSSICTAAVHSGLITLQNGGSVTIEVRPGRPVYGCSERNGVTSSCYGQWAESFVFISPKTEAAARAAEDETTVTWNVSASLVNLENGKTLKFKCPAHGTDGNVWGTDTYTADSSICNAAVHAGKFSRESGGSVEIEMRPGESSYQGTTRNGIKTNEYGPYGRSFVIK
jgi:hypothetical protein